MLLDRLLLNLAVHVEPFALCTVSTGWRLSLPGPPGAMFHYVLQGHGRVRGPNGSPQPLAPRWLLVVPAGLKHALEPAGEVQNERRVQPAPSGMPVCQIVAGSADAPALLVACGLVTVRYGPSLGLFDHLRELLVVDLSDVPQVSAAFQGILAEQSRPSPGSEAMTAALMNQCLVHLLRHISANPDCPLPWLTALQDARLARAIDLILKNPSAEYTVDSLAKAASMSRSAFAGRFTAAFGRPPMSLLHHVRMQHAAQLLAHGDALSVDEVASRVDFSSRSHFSRAFKRHSGVPPTTFRLGH